MEDENKNDFEKYVSRYCEHYNINSESAKKHKIVQEVKKYYEDTNCKNIITK